MNLVKRLKLVLAILIVAVGCFGLFIYENNALATIGANSANLLAPTYVIGSEYDGVIAHQYVTNGDSVRAGQKLFELRSDRLTMDIASNKIAVAGLTTKLSTEGGQILTAQSDGIVSQIQFFEGSFVSAGKPIATVSGVSGVSVRANFELSGPQFAKVHPDTPLMVQLGGTSIAATITSITQQSSNGHTITTINANLPRLQTRQAVYSTGTPTIVNMVIDTHPLYKELQQFAKTYIH